MSPTLAILSRSVSRPAALCRDATGWCVTTYQLCRQKRVSRHNSPAWGVNAGTLSAVLALSLLLQGADFVRAAQPNQLTPDQIAEGWINLFDGETLFGWQPTSDANWKVENGEIRVSSGNPGWLMTTSDFADYELHVEFKAPVTTNSGVFLRTPLEPKDPTKDCYEINIAPNENPFPTASLVGRKIAFEGWTAYPMASEDVRPPDVPEGLAEGWIPFDITARGGKITVNAIGQMAVEYADLHAVLRGRIGLQFREGEVAFRNIRLKPLDLKPMLTSEKLEGWRTDETREAKFALVKSSGSLPLEGRAGEGGEAGTSSTPPSLTLPSEGRGPESPNGGAAYELQVTGGPGELETEATYGDFVMQLECFVNGDGLNSGVFFRSIPGDFANGYESQIHNAVKDGDPTKPVDAGTGAIYRRTTARRVVSKDREWFTKTIVATGPHIATWVNGYQVTDWTDDRAPDPNPRKGLRTEPGTISLQAHDPTTNLRFRKFRIAELPSTLNDQAPMTNDQ
jgi:hypothetical protein